jgi:hypothetical protein
MTVMTAMAKNMSIDPASIYEGAKAIDTIDTLFKKIINHIHTRKFLNQLSSASPLHRYSNK